MQSFESILHIEPAGTDVFGARLEDFFGGTLGADLLARAALAALATCKDESTEVVLSGLHAIFLRPIPPGVPIELRVERLASAGDRVHRVVRIEGEAGESAHVVASFVPSGDGPDFQDIAPPPAVPEPDALPSTLETARAEGWADYAAGPIEFRRAGPLWPDPGAGESLVHLSWMKPRVALPNDPDLCTAALVFLSEFYSHWGFERRVGPTFANDRYERLDHTLHIHRDAVWDDWWLLEATSEIASAGRSVCHRKLFARDGRLVASASNQARIATR